MKEVKQHKNIQITTYKNDKFGSFFSKILFVLLFPIIFISCFFTEDK